MSTIGYVDSMREELSASSMREITAVTAAWESNPLRWQQDPAVWPELLAENLDSENYVSHLLQDPADLIDPASLTRHELFSPRMRTLLVRLHRVLIRDADPLALSVTMLDQVDPSETGRTAPAHTEQAGRPVMVQTDLELLNEREQLSVKDWEQLSAVWSKVSAMVSTVTTFLSATGELSEVEARTARVIDRQAEVTAAVAPQLRLAGVDRLADLPQE